MIKKIIILFLGSLLSIACMFVSIKFLSSYRIRNTSEISVTISNVFSLLFDDSSKGSWLILSILIAIIAIAISIAIIVCLLSLFSDDFLNNSISKIAIILWISLLLLSIIALVYYLLFAIIMFLLSALAICTLGAIGYGYGNGGPIHVRGHYRKGFYVKSHNRRRPRH